MLIGGQWTSAEANVFDSINPASGERNYRIAGAGPGHVELAVAAARAAQAEPAWRDMLPHRRAALLMRIADGMEANAGLLADAQRLENGKVVAECRSQVASAAATFRYYAAVCETQGEDVTPSRGAYLSMAIHEPHGVVAAITPWNSPLTMEAQKVAPALAAGNAVILKPSEVTPTPALELGRIALEAGLAPGLLNVLPGFGAEAGAPLVAHPGVDMVSFTGGTGSGRRIAELAARKLMPVALELGGKSPHIVFADADLDRAVDEAVKAKFATSGQDCLGANRFYIERPLYEEFCRRFTERTAALSVGPGLDDPDIGPLMNENAVAKQREHVADALAAGARLLCGGEGHALGPLFFQPTVLADVPDTAQIMREETFGPVAALTAFDGETEVIARANATEYGLVAYLHTKEPRAHLPRHPRPGIRHGRGEPHQGHRRADPLRRHEAIGPRPRGLAPGH